ncbi:MAG TPA: rhodanese-like domain-containing protein [Alphaproteobacteria bacterium]|jgi:rhodanese-related sulfurtransferase|nr:rhodanese-like domain-containing protein [Alphaproteobacteria bacterium]
MSDDIETTVEALSELLAAGGDLQLVDVRDDWEVAIAALPGARHIPLPALPTALDTLDAVRPVVLLCHHGMRSLQAAIWLRQQGFEQAISVAGGIDAWSRQIDPSVPTY